MINNKKIGVGIVTYNRKEGLLKLVNSLPRDLIDSLIIVNDGLSYQELDDLDCMVHHNDGNQGVGRSKNTALRYLQQQSVDHYFLIEDDIFVKDRTVFERYIDLSKKTGIQHFNFSQHGPHNVHPDGTPKPRFIIDYDNFSLPIFGACVGAFCYFSKRCLEEVGLFDEQFYNAIEHLEHTLRISQLGMHPSWYSFADLPDAQLYLGDDGWSGQQSTISGKPASRAISMVAASLFREKHGFMFSDIPVKSIEQIKKELITIHRRYATR